VPAWDRHPRPQTGAHVSLETRSSTMGPGGRLTAVYPTALLHEQGPGPVRARIPRHRSVRANIFQRGDALYILTALCMLHVESLHLHVLTNCTCMCPCDNPPSLRPPPPAQLGTPSSMLKILDELQQRVILGRCEHTAMRQPWQLMGYAAARVLQRIRKDFIGHAAAGVRCESWCRASTSSSSGRPPPHPHPTPHPPTARLVHVGIIEGRPFKGDS
jgi:hypothetical protein